MANTTTTVEHGAETAAHGADATVAHGADVVAHGAEAGGAAMPQLDPSTFSNQIFWLVVALVVIYVLLSRFALPRIAAVLAERSGTITNDIAAAEELKLQAAEAETAYTKALADARAEAGRIVAEAKAEIQAELDAELAKAETAISAKAAESEKAIAEIRANAVASVTEVAKDTAAAIVAALGGSADEAVINDAVAANMKG